MDRRLKFPRPMNRSGGFTLLELLLAFVVFALSFATVLEILSGSLRNTVRARHYSEAALTAQSVMDQVGLTIPLELGYQSDGREGDYEWELGIYQFGSVDEQNDYLALAELTQIELLQVELIVSWGEPPRDQSRRFSTVKAVLPETSEP